MLKYREYLLLRKLSNSNEIVSFEDIYKYLELTQRSVYTTIKEANNWLLNLNLDEIQNVRNHGYYLLPDNIPKVRKKIKEVLLNGEIEYPPEERVNLIQLILICSDYNVSRSTLANNVGSNLTTLKRDLKLINNSLKSLDISVNEKSLKVVGDEKRIRTLFFEIIENSDDSILFERINPFFKITNFDKSKIDDFIKSIELDTGLLFSDNARNQIQLFVEISLIRYRNNNTIKDLKKIDDINFNNVFDMTYSLLTNLEVTDKFVESESIWLTNFKLSRQTTHNVQLEKQSELYKITEEICKNFNLFLDNYDTMDKSFVDALYTHLLATKKRVEMKVQFKNVSDSTIQEDYPEIYLLTKKIIAPFESMLTDRLSNSEIGLIATYFGGELEKNNRKKFHRKKILIVCSSGIGTSRYLQIKLNNLYMDRIITQVITKHEYDELNEIVFDVVLSTVPIVKKGKKVINISEGLTKKDIKSINDFIDAESNFSTSRNNVKVAQILDIIGEYAKINDFGSLSEALESYLNSDKVDILSKRYKPRLSDLIPSDRIAILEQINDWRDAVKITGDLLENDGIIAPDYTENMVRQICKYGPYMSIGSNIMLLHAKPINTDIFNKPGMSFLRLENSIRFNEKISAKYIFALYSPNPDIHLKALTDLSFILEKPELFTQFKQAKTVDSYVEIFKKIKEVGD